MSQFWPEVIVGALLIGLGLLVLLVCVPRRSKWLAMQEKDLKRPIPILTDYASKSAYLLVIIGSLIIFLILSWFVADQLVIIQ